MRSRGLTRWTSTRSGTGHPDVDDPLGSGRQVRDCVTTGRVRLATCAGSSGNHTLGVWTNDRPRTAGLHKDALIVDEGSGDPPRTAVGLVAGPVGGVGWRRSADDSGAHEYGENGRSNSSGHRYSPFLSERVDWCLAERNEVGAQKSHEKSHEKSHGWFREIRVAAFLSSADE